MTGAQNQPVRDRRLEESWEINPSVSVWTTSETCEGALGSGDVSERCDRRIHNTCDKEDERFEEFVGQSWGGGVTASVSGSDQESGVIQLWLLSSNAVPACTTFSSKPCLRVTNSDLAFANHLNGSNP